MLDVLGLVLAVFVLYALLWLRAISGLILPRLRLSLLPQWQMPEAYADLFEQADAELTALGFERPFWMSLEPDPPGSTSQQVARVYRHAQEAALTATVMPPVEVTQPNRPVLALSTALADDSSVTTFAFSPSSAFFGTARQRRRSVPAKSAAALLEAHRAWRSTFASADATEARDDAEVVVRNERRYGQMLDELVGTRVLRADAQGQLRLRFGAMLRAAWLLLTAPRVPKPTAPVPPARQLALLGVFERLRARVPTRGVQWFCFLVSCALFALAGVLFWDARVAMILFVVLVIHELGHFLAMRALGYRNVQMVLLPLFGGVTTGVESDPDGTHRALVSLAGPLPGIALGWGLLWASWPGAGPGLLSAQWLAPAVVLLLVNVLNLLPVPPLDGSQFLQALLARRWARVGVVLLAALALAGLVLAWWLQSLLLGVIVGLQLVGVGALWREARQLRLLQREFAHTLPTPAQRDARLLELVGGDEPRAPLVRRYLRVLRLRSLLELRAPRPWAALVLVLVYVAALAAPALLLPREMRALFAGWGPRASVPAVDPTERYRKTAQTLSLDQLVDGIAEAQRNAEPETAVQTSAPVPAEAAFTTAEQGLGRTIPPELRDLMRSPRRQVLGVVAPESVHPAQEAPAGTMLEGLDPTKTFELGITDPPGHYASRAVPVSSLQRMWVVAGEAPYLVLYDAGDDPALACCRVVDLEEDDVNAYPSLRAWLVERYAAAQFLADAQRAQKERLAVARGDAAGWDFPTLLKRLDDEPVPRSAWPDNDPSPRSGAALDAAEQRLGFVLPPDYRAFLMQRNGLPSAQLLALEDVHAFDPSVPVAAAFARIASGRDTAGAPLAGRALVIAEVRIKPGDGAATRMPTILLRQDGAHADYLDLSTQRRYDTLESLLRERYAVQRSMRGD